MKWEDIENNHIRDIADRLSERALALEEAILPLTVKAFAATVDSR